MNCYANGVWPVMLTPFTPKGEVDEDALYALVEWYIEKGVDGLFASCQSSEIFHMRFSERMRIAQITVKAAEWALRTVIQAFWLRGNLAYFFEIAGYPLKDRPYTGEFIGTLAAYVRMREPPWPN